MTEIDRNIKKKAKIERPFELYFALFLIIIVAIILTQSLFLTGAATLKLPRPYYLAVFGLGILFIIFFLFYKRKKKKRHHTRVELRILMLIALILALVLVVWKAPTITGGFIGVGEVTKHTQDLNLVIDEDGTYEWELENVSESFYLTSIKLTGSVIGDGRAKVYIDNVEGDRYLVVDSRDIEGGLTEITGFAVAGPGEGEGEKPEKEKKEKPEKESEESTGEVEESGAEGEAEAEAEAESEEAIEETEGEAEEEQPTEETTEEATEGEAEEEILPEEGEGEAEEELPEEEEVVNETVKEEFEENVTEEEEINVTTEPENKTLINETLEELNVTEEINITEEVNVTLNETLNETLINETIPLIFKKICAETCDLEEQDGFTEDSYTLIFEVSDGTILELDSITYNFEDLALNISYEKIEEDKGFDAIIDSATLQDGDLVVNFHHEANKPQQISIEGDVNYDLSTDLAEPGENITLIVYNWDNDYFEIHIGSDTEVFAFGPIPEFLFEVDIEDAEGSPVDADIEFIDTVTNDIDYSETAVIAVEEIPGPERAPRAGKSFSMNVSKGKYDIRVKPKEHPIKEIEFEDVLVEQDITEFIDIDDVPEFGDYVEVYAIDPTQFNFTSATVTVIAKGTALYKCKDWQYSNQTCAGEWVKLMDIIPGQEYTFELTPEDPGFAELTIQQCNAADEEASSGSFVDSCDNSYPGTALFDDDTTYEVHSLTKSPQTWAGLRTKSYNTSVTECSAITQVYFCYKWWSDTDNIQNCDISVDANGGASYSAVTTTCPGTSEPGSVTCTNITSLESWTCNNFFNATGAWAKSEVQHSGTAKPSTYYITWDVFYFNVTYSEADVTPPTYSNLKESPTDPATYAPSQTYTFNATWTDNVAVDTVKLEFDGTNYTVTDKIGDEYYKSFTDLAAGTYDYVWYANDTSDNWNNTGTLNYTINKATTVITLTATPSWTEDYGTQTNVSCSANNAEVTVNLYRDGNPVSNPDVQTLGAGTYDYTCNNSATQNYTAAEETNTLTINQVATTTYLYLNGNRSNLTVSYGTQTNATATTSIGSVTLYRDGSPVSNPEITTLEAGTYNYTAVNPGSANYSSSSETWWLTVNKITSTCTLTFDPASPQTYGTQVNASCSCTNPEASAKLYRNGQDVTATENNQYVTLPADTHNYVCNVTETTNYTSAEDTDSYVINKATTVITLTATPSWTEDYGTQTNVSCEANNAEVTINLYREGSPVSNPNVQTLGAGTYNYTCNNSATQNYTADSISDVLTVNKAADAVNLYLNGNQSNLTITYGTQSNATATSTSGTEQLFRDGASVSNPEIATLAAGTYQYNANSTGNQNYTAGADLNYYLTVNKASSSVNLLLNGADANVTVDQGDSVNKTGQTITGEGNLELYEQGGLIASGPSPLTNISTYNDVGLYNITVVHPATTNYTASSETHWITVRDKTPPVVNLEVPANASTDTDGNITFEYNVTDADSDVAGCSLIFDGSVDQTDNTITEGVTQNFTKTGLATGTYTWSVNCTDDSVNANEGVSETRTLIIDLPQGVSLSYPGDKSTNRSINASYIITIENTGLETDNFTLSLVNVNNADVAQLSQSQITNLPAGQNTTVSLDVTDDIQGAYVVNITATSEKDANISDTISITTTVLGTLYAYVTEPSETPPPVYYQGQSVLLKGYVYDDLGTPMPGATVVFEPINGSNVYLCSSVNYEGAGVYNCTLTTSGMAVPLYYDVRINASKTYYNSASTINSSVFFLSYDTSAELDLQKVPSVESVTQTQIDYNITLYLTNLRGSSENTNLTDPDVPPAGQTWSEGTLMAETVTESYTLTYNRTSSEQLVTLQKANASGWDPIYGVYVFTESNQPVIIIPENESLEQLTLIKNIIYLAQNDTAVNYTIVDEVVNSGDVPLTGISVVDTDISLTTVIDLAEGQSWSTSGNITLDKDAQSKVHNFTKTSAFVNSVYYYSNQPSIVIPGYGGPYDVIITKLPGSVETSRSITGTIKVINQNTEVAEDRTLRTWIETQDGTILDEDVRVIYVGKNDSITTQVTLTAPSSTGTYYFNTELTWPTSSADASKSFSVVSPEEGVAGGAGGGAFPPVCGDGICETSEDLGGANECLLDCGYDCDLDGIKESWQDCVAVAITGAAIADDVIDNIIALRNKYSELKEQIGELAATGIDVSAAEDLLEELMSLIKEAEDKAARGELDWARNIISNAFNKLKVLVNVIDELGPKKAVAFAPFWESYKVLFMILAILIAASFMAMYIMRRREEMKVEGFLKEEREKLEAMEKQIDSKLDEMLKKKKK